MLHLRPRGAMPLELCLAVMCVWVNSWDLFWDDDDIILIFYLILSLDNQRYHDPYIPAPRIDFAHLQGRSKDLFRFYRDDLIALADLLLLPAVIITSHRDYVHNWEALSIVCRRLAYPNRWSDLRPLFGRSTAALCRVFLFYDGFYFR